MPRSTSLVAAPPDPAGVVAGCDWRAHHCSRAILRGSLVPRNLRVRGTSSRPRSRRSSGERTVISRASAACKLRHTRSTSAPVHHERGELPRSRTSRAFCRHASTASAFDADFPCGRSRTRARSCVNRWWRTIARSRQAARVLGAAHFRDLASSTFVDVTRLIVPEAVQRRGLCRTRRLSGDWRPDRA